MKSIEILVQNELTKELGHSNFRMPMFFDKPINIGKQKNLMENQHGLIKDFLDKVAEISLNALRENDIDILNIIYSENYMGMSTTYHKNLPKSCWDRPIFYRTDQSLSGKIYEIQAPGSGWGDLYLFAKCFSAMGYDIPEMMLKFPDVYADNIINATRCREPKIFHMLDASSVPYSMRYLIEITKQKLKYWGEDKDVAMQDIDCLISHSVVSMLSSNFFKIYLRNAEAGKCKFAVPPNLIYDEKAIYVLPFHRKTRMYFSDDVRNIFPFTTIIENGGFYNKYGEFVEIEKFAKRKPSERKFYLKYGGPDVSRNWGSRSVYRLTQNDCVHLLERANQLSQKGEIWLIQEDVSKDEPYAISEDMAKIEKKHMKLSAYYGINSFMGVKVMARQHFKVHGQIDTLVGLGI